MPAKPHKGTRMKPNSIALLTLGVSLLALSANGQDRLTREEYIQKYKSLAVEEMEVYGIPASITMAQALLESDNGNGRLAREGNNHFGIKCKSTWTGATISHDDDAKGECFRKYPSVEASFNDHSEFLDKSARYQDLFKLDPMDYKGWAYGLKQAGYATNPAYAELLIKIIEDNQLYHLDRGEEIAPPIMGTPVTEEPQQLVAETEQKPKEVVDVDNYSVAVTGQGGQHTVYHNNGSEFTTARPGDTYATIASEFGLTVKKLLKYNDETTVPALRPGEMVYLRPKGKRSENGKLIHVAKEGETLHSISQTYGIRLKNLCNMNRRTPDSEVKAGQQIRLM